jgi:hypothetical protein
MSSVKRCTARSTSARDTGGSGGGKFRPATGEVLPAGAPLGLAEKAGF